MTAHGVETPILAACLCGDDPQLQVMRDLMNGGMGQLDASRIAFGNQPAATADRDVWSTWVRVEVRRIGNVARRQLGLPALPLMDGATS